MAENRNKQKKKKGIGAGWLIFFVIIMLSNLMENVDTGSFRRFMFQLRIFALRLGVPVESLILAPFLLLALLVAVVKLARKKAKEREADTPTMSRARASAAVRRPDPRTKSFTEPEAYCFSCEASGDDHFKRDRQTRIRQLDDWLKNGLIDREEYRVLKARFERDL